MDARITNSAANGRQLDPREQHFRITSPHLGLSLLRYLPPLGGEAPRSPLRPWRNLLLGAVDRASI